MLLEIINDRRSGKSQSLSGDDSDALSVMLKSESYGGKDDAIIEELFSFYVAGMKTIQITTTNLIYYMTKHTDLRERLFKEILPVVEKASDDI